MVGGRGRGEELNAEGAKITQRCGEEKRRGGEEGNGWARKTPSVGVDADTSPGGPGEAKDGE